MSQLALLFSLLPALMLVPAESPPAPPSEQAIADFLADPCAFARQIAEQQPCLSPDDCNAFQEWRQMFGVPRNEYLQPDLADQRVVGPSDWRNPYRSLREVPSLYPCPAESGAEAEAAQARRE